MSALNLVNHCPACGAEEGLDVLIARMIEDDDARRLIADVLTWSMPIGGQVIRYLRLFKPAKQQLRMRTAHQVLAELVPALRGGTFERTGRVWHMSKDAWRTALDTVLEAHAKGSLRLPLQGNGYLFEVAMRQADRAEGREEAQAIEDQRHRAGQRTAAPQAITDVVAAALPAAGPKVAPLAPPAGTSPLVRKLRAELAQKRSGHVQPNQGQ